MDHAPPKGSQHTSQKITANWSDHVVDEVDFYRCQFSQCVFARTVFRNCVFEDCEFESSDLALAKISGSSFNTVVFRGCKLFSIAWHEKGFRFDVTFLDCQLDYSSFFGMKLNKITFTGSRLKEVTFVDAVVREGRFDRCDLTGAVFNHTDLSRADFSGAHHYQIDVTYNQVKGAIFELPEAVSLLSHLGIKVK